MTLYQIKLCICQLAYDLNKSKAWNVFDDYVLRYGGNIFYDSILSNTFYDAIQTQLTHKQLFELMTELLDKYSRAEVVEIMRQITGTREYHTLLTDMYNKRVVGL